MWDKLIYWSQPAGGKIVTEYLLALVIILGLLTTVSQLAILAGVLPRGWMP